jgi:uncharacterized protein
MTHPLRFKTAIRFASLGLFAWTAGCNVIPPPTEDATRYYLLSEPAAAGPGRTAGSGGIRIGLKSIAVAGYLKNREMVVRRGANEIAFKDYARWAEPLDAAISRSLRAGLLQAPAVADVLVPPFPLEGERNYDVDIQVIQCEGAAAAGGGSVAKFSAIVDITTTGAAPSAIAHHVFTAPDAAWNGKDYGQLAGLLSDAVAQLAADVIAAIPPKS